MIRNVIMKMVFFTLMGSSGYDKIIVISISNMRNRSAVIKNCIENCCLLCVIMLNPHSNWDCLFS